MNEMIERVARAIADAENVCSDGSRTDMHILVRPYHRNAARAAIASIPLIVAAREWSTARRACLAGAAVTPEAYDRLARAEAVLQSAALADDTTKG